MRGRVRYNPRAIRAARFQKGLTQDALAAAVGCARNTISRAELGEACSDGLGLRIANALGVDPESLLYDERQHAMPPDGLALTAPEQQAIAGMRSLDVDGRRLVLHLIAELAAGAAPWRALMACGALIPDESRAGPRRT